MLAFFRRVFGRGARLEAKTDRLLELQEQTMSNIDKFNDVMGKMNDATNKIASELAALRAELKAAKDAGQAPTDEQIAKLEAFEAKLEALGADPADPVPAASPDPAPAA